MTLTLTRETQRIQESPDRRTVVTVRGLRKVYGAVEVVAGIDLTVFEGEIYLKLVEEAS